MAKTVHIFVSILIFVVVVSLAAAAGYWSYVIQHWPWWGAVSMAMGVFALYFLVLFVKKYFIRRHEKKFIRRIVDHGEVLAEGARPEQLAVQELEKSWKNNLDLLKSSHLKQKGNPLYVLPWYLTMGESGVGKSTMLANAGIATSFTELQNRRGQVGPTRNCDWVFFDNAVIIDTAGRYSVPLDSDREQSEWKRFLLLLAKARRREPLNGIILFVAADDLVQGKNQELRRKGQVLRNRIHSLMRTIGFRIPVYVMVTRMDTVPGFTEFAELLPEKARAQVMGQLNSQATPYWHEVLDQAGNGLNQGLQKIRMALVSRSEGRKAAFFALPLQFDLLHKGLQPFLDALFSENNYQETPSLQGIFFGCGLCRKSPIPSFLKSSAKDEAQAEPGFNSAFIQHFFGRVLPQTRWNFTPVKELVVWKRVVHNLAILSWLCVLAFAAGLVGLSYFHNQNVYALLPNQTADIGRQVPAGNSVLIALEKMRLAILEVEAANTSWKRPFMVFTNGIQAEKAYKKEYCRLFSTTLLDPMDTRFEQAVSGVDPATSLELYADYCAYAVEQSIYLQNYLVGKQQSEFGSFSQAVSAVLSIDNTGLLSEAGSYFPNLNRSYLAWSQDKTGIEERLASMQKTLQKLLAKNQGDISWLYTVSIADTPPVTLADFWKHQQSTVSNSVLVPGAFTRKGRIKIEKFLSAVERAGAGTGVITKLRQGYHDSYSGLFVHWWKLFGDNFQDGELELTTDADWREAAILMAAADNPYFQMMETMAKELSSFARDTDSEVPNWGKAVIAVNNVRKLAATSNTTKNVKPSLFARVTAEKDKVTAETLQDVDPAKAKSIDKQLKLAGSWKKYEIGLAGLDLITPYKEKAAAQFTAWFKQAAGTGKEQSVFAAAYDAWVALETMGRNTYADPFVWRIIEGPFIFLQDFAARETAQVLQEKWQENVVAATADLDPDKISAVLYAQPGGLVWQYLQKYADPFVMKSVEGYKARTFYGRSLIFEPDFYSILNLGSAVVVNARPQYTVTLTTKPMEVNSKARVEPIYCVFHIQCAKKQYILENDNFPRELSVDWGQDKCGDVTLTIGFPSLKLTKKWTGPLAFVRFLDQFSKGSYHFVPEDFPSDAGYLKEHGVTFIGITYVLTGEQGVLQLLNEPPKKLQDRIILPEKQVSAKTIPRLSGRVISEFVEPATAPRPDQQAKHKRQPPQKIVTPRKNTSEKSKPANWHDAQWLLDQDPARYTVQIMSLQSIEYIAKAFAEVPEKQHNAVYKKTVQGKQWYVLVSGQFDDVTEALQYLKSLPADLQKAGPMVRPLWEIQESLSSAALDNKSAGIDKKTAVQEQVLGKNRTGETDDGAAHSAPGKHEVSGASQ